MVWDAVVGWNLKTDELRFMNLDEIETADSCGLEKEH